MAFDWKKTIATVAPWIASALPGPFGALAQTAVKAALNLPPDSSEDDINSAMGKLTGDQIVALKNAENDFKLKMQQAGFDQADKLAQIAAEDRDSARKREIAVKDRTPMILAIFVTLGFFGLLGFMALETVPQANAAILNTMLGSLGTGWLAILYYYFGSSAGSDRKTEIIATQQQPAPNK